MHILGFFAQGEKSGPAELGLFVCFQSAPKGIPHPAALPNPLVPPEARALGRAFPIGNRLTGAGALLRARPTTLAVMQ